jgi:N-acetylmuramoyl-L-alanine amidase
VIFLKHTHFSKPFLKSTLSFSFLFVSAFFLLCLAFYGMDSALSPNASSPVDAKANSHPVVILDPGHGGIDSGASPEKGVEEKNLNLALAKKLGEFLKAGGLDVIYTRTEDVMLTCEGAPTRKTGDLMGRIKVAEEYTDAIFVSLHMNTLPNQKYSGLQTFYSDKNALNQALARQIQSDVCTHLQPQNNRSEKSSDGKIYLLDRLDCPSVLIECGFLTNPEESKKLQSEEYQNELAFTISQSLLQFAHDKKKTE